MQIPPGSASASRRAATLTPSPKNLGDDVAEVDPDAEPDPAVLGYPGLTIDHRPLHLGGTAHRVNDAGEFRQHPVAGSLHDPTGMLADLRVDELVAMRLEAFVRPCLVCAHQARIARHIGGKDRGETAGRGHGCAAHPAPVNRRAHYTAQRVQSDIWLSASKGVQRIERLDPQRLEMAKVQAQDH